MSMPGRVVIKTPNRWDQDRLPQVMAFNPSSGRVRAATPAEVDKYMAEEIRGTIYFQAGGAPVMFRPMPQWVQLELDLESTLLQENNADSTSVPE